MEEQVWIVLHPGRSGIENDATGQIAVVGASKTLSGVADTNPGFSQQPNATLTGSLGTIQGSGRFSGALTNTFFPTPGNTANTITVEFYLVDSGHGLFTETDPLSSGELSL